MFRLTRFLFTALLLGTVATATFAQTSEQTTTARDRQSVNITVYNSNLGLVRETRRLTLPAGRIALRFADVTAQIRPETVHLASLTAPSSLRILEQNYQYDLLNPAKLLDKFVGRDLTLVLRRYQNNTENFEPVQATLLSNNGGQVWRINGQIVINPTNIAEMRFPDLPKNLVATPTRVPSGAGEDGWNPGPTAHPGRSAKLSDNATGRMVMLRPPPGPTDLPPVP